MDAEQYLDMLFPFRGIDLYAAFQSQRPGTTRVGQNVRTFEPSTQRGRGGSRPGLTEFIPQALPLSFVSGSRKIQHLNIIVDPTPAALAGAVDDPDGVLDPSTNPPGSDPTDPNDHRVRNRGRRIRPGGWGWRPNRNLPPAKPGTAPQYAQSASFLVASDFFFFPFPGDVAKGALILAAFVSSFNVPLPNSNHFNPQDTAGNTYTQVGSRIMAVDGSGGQYWLDVYSARNKTAGPVAINPGPGASPHLIIPIMIIAEYRHAGAIDRITTLTADTSGTVFDMSPVPTGGSHRSCVAFIVRGGNNPFNISTLFTENFRENPVQFPEAALMEDVIETGFAVDVSMGAQSGAPVSGAFGWVGLAISIKPG